MGCGESDSCDLGPLFLDTRNVHTSRAMKQQRLEEERADDNQFLKTSHLEIWIGNDAPLLCVKVTCG